MTFLLVADDPYPVDALPYCTHAQDVCNNDPGCKSKVSTPACIKKNINFLAVQKMMRFRIRLLRNADPDLTSVNPHGLFYRGGGVMKRFPYTHIPLLLFFLQFSSEMNSTRPLYPILVPITKYSM